MSARKHLVKVSILGEEYPLRSEAPPEHVRAVAAHVDDAVRRVLNGGVVETHKAAVLAALQLTDELFRARAALEEATAGVRQLSGEVRRMLPPQKRGLLTPAERARTSGGVAAGEGQEAPVTGRRGGEEEGEGG